MTKPDPQTPAELIAGGQGLVKMLAVRIHRRFHQMYDLDDLIAFGQVGLVEAANRFNPQLGNQFSTFAYYRIRGAIYEGIAQMSGTSRGSFRSSRFSQRASELLEGIPDPPDDSGLRGDVQWFASVSQRMFVASLLCEPGDDDDPMASLADPGTVAPDAEAEARELCGLLRNAVAELPEQSRTLVEAIYFEGVTLEEAAGRIGVSKSWGSRLHGKILEQLGNRLKYTPYGRE
jgi:RNA polymerase sigma factor FliA